ncbi:MAG: outer membrane protein assembly factor BamB family protein [bacterium]
MKRKSLLPCLIVAIVMIATGCRNKPPQIPTKPAGPTQVEPGDSAVYSTVTTDPNKDRVLYIWDWGDGSQDTTGLKRSGDTVKSSHLWDTVGLYPVRVRAKDEKGNFSPEWSDTLIVQVQFGENQKPLVDAPVGPDSGWVGQWQVFKAIATDPNGDSVKIKFLWDEGQTSLISPLVGSGDTVVDSVKYLYRGIKKIRCLAWDQSGLMSDTSPEKLFLSLQENTAPYQPLVSGPARGIANGPYYRFYATTTDPQGDRVRYKFIYSDGRTSEWTPLGPPGHRGIDSTRFTAPGTYYIRAIAQDSLGLYSDTSLPKPFEVVGEGSILWALAAEEFVSSPALSTVSTGTETRPAIIVGGLDAQIYAIDPYQAETLFRVTQAGEWEEFISSPAIGPDDCIYIGNENGILYAINRSGQTRWYFPELPGPDAISVSPALDGNCIYFAGEDRILHKLQDHGTGYTELWNYTLTSEVNSSPVILPDSRVLVIDDSGYVTCLNPDGTLSYQFFVNAAVQSSPAVDNSGNIYFGTDQGDLIALSPAGESLWTYHIPSRFNDIASSPVIDANGNIYFGCEDGYLYKLSPAGELLWQCEIHPTAAITSTPLLTADGYIYVTAPADSIFEKLYCINPDGAKAWEILLELPASPKPRFSVDLFPSPVIDQFGIIYIATPNGGIFACAGRPTTLMQSPWPMFRHDIRHTGKSGAGYRK